MGMRAVPEIVLLLLITGCGAGGLTLYNKAIHDRPFTDFPPVEEPANPVRLGINISGVSDYSTEFIWVDIMPYMRIEGETSQGAVDFISAQFDSNGYPLYLETGQRINFGFGAGTDHIWPEGQYHVFFDGVGTLEGRTSNETLVQDLGGGHQIWEIGSEYEWFGFALTETVLGNHLKNLRIIMPGFENSYLTEPLHPSFIEHWSFVEAFRFMDTIGTNNSPVEYWNDLRGPSDICQHSMAGDLEAQGGRSGVAVAKMVEICNIMDKDAWFCIPHLADDDCIRSFAEFVRDNLEPERKVYIEYSNEVWNFIFTQAGYATDTGVALGITEGGALEYHVMRSGQMYAIWEDVFGTGADRVVNVFAWQAVDEYWWERALDEFFTNTTYNPAQTMPELYAIAPYFNDTQNMENWTVNTLFRESVELPSHDLNVFNQIERVTRRQLSCDERNIELGCYEAGQHYVEPVELCIEANRDERMYDCYRLYISGWATNCGGLMMLYSSCTLPGENGSWGLIEGWNQNIQTAPKYLAARSFFE